LRCPCLVDDATRESPALLPDFSIGGARVLRMLDELAWHGLPEEIVLDNRERPHSALGYEPPARFARRLGAPGLDEGPRPSPALAPASSPCYDVNGSPSSWT
jgi:hypothetical protein